MALSSYTDLVAAIADWLDDPSLSAQADTFITLAEAKFNRLLRMPQMEATATLQVEAQSEYATFPGVLEIKALSIVGDHGVTRYDRTIQQTTLANLKDQYGGSYGCPEVYAVSGTHVYLGPIPKLDTTFSLTYYSAIPQLTADNPSNWLLSIHPDVYLWGCLAAAELRGWNDERLPLVKGALDEALAEIQATGLKRQWGATPLRAMTGMRQVGGVAW